MDTAAMDATTMQIERLVREVLAELARAPAPAAEKPGERGASTAAKPAAPQAATPVAGEAKGELNVAAPLVTLAQVSGRLAGIHRLVVPRHAVVTPAVRDELRRRNVTLVRAASSVLKKEASGARAAGDVQTAPIPRLVLAVDKRVDAAPLTATLGAAGIAVELQRIDCLIAATDYLAAELHKPDTLSAVLSPHWAAAVCLANRHPGVRAAAAGDASAAAAATGAVGANMLILDTRSGSAPHWTQMLDDFCRAGVRPCPETLQKRLG